jgi:hypothetical protein
MSSVEFIQIQILKAEDALAEARDALLQIRRPADAKRVLEHLLRAADYIEQAVDGCGGRSLQE